MKYFLILLLLFFVIGCSHNCRCNKEMVLLDCATIVSVNTFNSSVYDYTTIEFENNHFMLLPRVLGDRMKAGQKGCLYYVEQDSPENEFVYYWKVSGKKK